MQVTNEGGFLNHANSGRTTPRAMIIYCRDCLLEGTELADTADAGTIHEGRAVCLRHFKGLLEGVLAERIPDSFDTELAHHMLHNGSPTRC